MGSHMYILVFPHRMSWQYSIRNCSIVGSAITFPMVLPYFPVPTVLPQNFPHYPW